MKSRISAVTLMAVVLVGTVALTQGTKKSDAAPSQASKEFGSKDSSKWSDTTEKSATTPEQKAWMNKGKPESLTGEVVDVSCYLQLGKMGAAHKDCGGKCVRAGQPIGLLTSAKMLYLVIPEEHNPRRDGQTNIRDAFADAMGEQVKVTGVVQQTPQGKAIFVSDMEVQKAKS